MQTLQTTRPAETGKQRASYCLDRLSLRLFLVNEKTFRQGSNPMVKLPCSMPKTGKTVDPERPITQEPLPKAIAIQFSEAIQT